MIETAPYWFAVHLWQVSLLFLLIWGITRWLRERSRHLSLVLWLSFFVKCLTPPLIISPIAFLSALTPTEIIERYFDPVSADVSFDTSLAENADGIATLGSPTRSPAIGKSVARSVTMQKKQLKQDLSRDNRTAGTKSSFTMLHAGFLFVSAWFLGGLLYLVICVGRYVRLVRKIDRDSVTLHATTDVSQMSFRIHESKNLLVQFLKEVECDAQSVCIRICDQMETPFSYGVWKPTIVLPKSLIESNVPLAPVIAHELCHLWRRDHWLGWLQLAAQTVFWFHPLVHWAARELNRWCEVCCDDDTMRIFSLSPSSYSKGLLDAITIQRRVCASVHWVPAISHSQMNKQRIKMILKGRRSGRFRNTQGVATAIVLILIIPAVGSASSEIEQAGGTETAPLTANPISPSIEPVVRYSPPANGTITKLRFFEGRWNVFIGANQVAESEFKFERSGRMIREDWTSVNGQTAQGITFIDPVTDQVRMTFVDSSATVTELLGEIEDGVLKMSGKATNPNGRQGVIEYEITPQDSDALSVKVYGVDGEQRKLVSSIRYARKK